jgi:SAM-dependent methyltransferase
MVHNHSPSEQQGIFPPPPPNPAAKGEYDAEWVESFLNTSDRLARYPLSAHYDPRWIFENERGSHSLWLMESLATCLDLKPGMRVLDLGCGKASAAIFLAREFDLQVWAADRDTSPTENWGRVRAAGLEQQVFPLRAKANELPFPEDFFDAIVGINSLQFFGTDDLYLSTHLVRWVKPGGQIGMVVPGLLAEFEEGVPEYLKPYWDQVFYSWHSPSWWRSLWGKTGLVEIEVADTFPDGEGYTIFSTWAQVVKSASPLLTVDGGRNISFVRLVARRK